MNLAQFLNPMYWFTIDPPIVTGLGGNILFATFALLFVFGVVARVVASNRTQDRYVQQLGERVGTMLVTMGILGVILFFISYERIQLFGARFWYPVWLGGFVFWIVMLVRFAKRDIPAMRAKAQSRSAVSKYLPRKKKKKKRKR